MSIPNFRPNIRDVMWDVVVIATPNLLVGIIIKTSKVHRRDVGCGSHCCPW